MYFKQLTLLIKFISVGQDLIVIKTRIDYNVQFVYLPKIFQIIIHIHISQLVNINL